MQIKRHFMRWQVKQGVQVKFSGVNSFIKATIHDISMMGMQISLDEELPREKSFPMTVRLAGGLQWEVEPWVSWHTRDEKEHCYGLYFARIHDAEKEKIWNFINRACQDQVCAMRWKAATDEGADGCTADRRIFQRFSLHCPMLFAEAAAGERHNAEVVDFSAKGIGMLSSVPVSVGEYLRMWLHFPCQEGDIFTGGKVSWTQQLVDGRYRAGVELASADLMGITGLIR